MDIEQIREDLETHFPQWSSRIRMLHFQDASNISTVNNDGRTIYYNEQFMSRLNRENRTFFMAQQLMHIQLAHHARRGERDRAVWKRASDAVVNTMLREDGFVLPESVMLVKDASGQSAEEMYEVLYAQWDGTLEADPDEGREFVEAEQTEQSKEAGKESQAHAIELDDPGLAAAVAGLAEALEPSMQIDFDWFPGSTIRDGMLRYDFKPYPVAHAEILLDTSASVDAQLLRYFVRAVKALMLEDAVVRVGCFDTRFYGFQDVTCEDDIENLELHGAGGTDFTVAVNAFTGDAENQIIFTDGYAEMPEEHCNAVWVVYGTMPIHPNGGRVIYVKPSEEKEKHEIDFLIT